MTGQVTALAAQGYSNKWIGFTLGTTASTVATQLTHGLQKLGVVSRVELAAAFSCWPDAVRSAPVPHFVPVPSHGLRFTSLCGDALLIGFDTSLSIGRSLRSLLPQRQFDIVSLALQSLSDREIAERLDLSIHIVANDLRATYVALNASSRAELFAKLASHGDLEA